MYCHTKVEQFFKQVRHKMYKYLVIYAFLCPFYTIAHRELWDERSFCLTLNSVRNNCRMACNFFQIMAFGQMFVCLVTILLWTHAVTCIDPISLAIGAGAAIHGTWNSLVCRYKECCDSSWIPFNFESKSSSHFGSNCDRYVTHTMKRLICLWYWS